MKQIIHFFSSENLSNVASEILVKVFRVFLYLFFSMLFVFMFTSLWLGMQEFFDRWPEALENLNRAFIHFTK